MKHVAPTIRRSILVAEVLRVFIEEVLKIRNQVLSGFWIKVDGVEGPLPVGIGLILDPYLNIRDIDL